jgi:hypothetical protein
MFGYQFAYQLVVIGFALSGGCYGKAAMNICVQVFVCSSPFMALGLIPMTGLA